MAISMIEPAVHEDAAVALLNKEQYEEAQVRALLALASAVNRLADSQRPQ